MQRIPLEDGAAAWRMANVEFVEGTEPPLEEDVAEPSASASRNALAVELSHDSPNREPS